MIEGPVEERMRLEVVEKDIADFVKTAAFAEYRRSREKEIADLRDSIVSMDPLTREDEIESLKMRGDLRTTEQFLTLFEDTAASLKHRIAQLREREQPSSVQ